MKKKAKKILPRATRTTRKKEAARIAYRKAYNAKRRKLYAYWRNLGYKRKFIRMKGLTSEVNSMHYFRRYKAEHKGKKLIPPVELSKKQIARLESLAKVEGRASVVMKRWDKLGAVERAYRLENMHRFYRSMAKATGKSVAQVKAEFLRDVSHIRTQADFYIALDKQYKEKVGIRLT